MNAKAKITSKGQITLPKELRQRLNVKEGDEIEFVEENGKTWVRPRNVDIMDLAGMLHRPGMRPISIEEMDEAVMEAVADDDERIRREWGEDQK